jgi:heme/copper-type cytochrome/quinol oxidase subunit 4
VIFVKDTLYGILAVVSAVVALASFLYFQRGADTVWLYIAIVCVVATLALGALFLSGRVNKQEDIHITE